jgi:hypothetical protein
VRGGSVGQIQAVRGVGWGGRWCTHFEGQSEEGLTRMTPPWLCASVKGAHRWQATVEVQGGGSLAEEEAGACTVVREALVGPGDDQSGPTMVRSWWKWWWRATGDGSESFEKSLVLLSLINCHISFNFGSSSCPSRNSVSKIRSTSIATMTSFAIARFRYSISQCNSGHMLLVKVALQYFFWLKASATTLALPGW